MKEKPVPRPENSDEIRDRFTARKLTDEDVWEIRRLFRAGASKADLCRMYAVSNPTIFNAIHGEKTYKDV